ncbi:unnamed protein product [Clonostachys solani]|uniref:ribonuclease H n=1 Tax=Clonostachys solani TaxID=160281 RepID=A0A9P0EM20_9HYPO|nr:unnamed protein product [Clonostachys solani]
MAQHDSDEDDQPRMILDRRGDFTIINSEPQTRFKIGELAALGAQMAGGVLAVRPIPNPQSVAHAKDAMGNGEAGVWTGTAFNAPATLSPQSIFASRRINTLNDHINPERFMIRRRYSPGLAGLKTMAVFTDGACASNGLATPKGGFAFSASDATDGLHAQRLEDTGPTDTAHTATNNRAELRAVIGFLECRSWWGEGWTRIVVMTDSEYVAKGATVWIRKWASNDWKTAAGKPVANRDL